MSVQMDLEEEDDDLYQPEEPQVDGEEEKKPPPAELEEGEEEDEGAAMDEEDSDDSDDDSDIDIITERKDGTKAAPPSQVKYSDIRNIPQRTTENDIPVKAAPAPVKKEETLATRQSSTLNIAAPSADKTSAAASKSTIDINGIPIHVATGKPITQVNIDEDLPDNDKPWRKAGTDISDYFNYGFDEFTWALYAAKQDSVRGEFSADAVSANNKRLMEDFNMMMGMGGMPGAPQAGGGSGGGGGGGAGGGQGMDGSGMTPDMQAMMQQMMASGMDPSQMDPSQMAALFGGMQGAGGGQGGQGMQGQNFGGGNFGGNQGGYGFDQSMGGGGGGGGGRGGFGGRRGRGRW